MGLGLTDAEVIDAALKYSVSAGSNAVALDQNLRNRAAFRLKELSDDCLGEAPFWFKHTSDTITTVGAQEYIAMPGDFGTMDDQTQLWISGRQMPLRYQDPDILYGFRQNATRSGQPEIYTLQGMTDGIPLVQLYPTPNAAYAIYVDQYVRRFPDIVDRPGPCAAATNGVGVLSGTYFWRITYVTAVGECEAGVVSPVAGGLALTLEEAVLTSIPVSFSHSVTARRVYRTAGTGFAPYLLVGEIPDNITTTIEDNVADGALGATAPTPTTATTGMQTYPEDFHLTVFVRGLARAMLEASGDQTDWKNDWRGAVKKRWADHRQGQSQPQAMAPYGSVAGPVRATSWRYRIS